MTWTIGETLEDTFRSFTRNWLALVVGNLVATLVAVFPVGLCVGLTLPTLLAKTADAGAGGEIAIGGAVGVLTLSGISALVLAIMFAPALSRIALAAARGERPRIRDVFDFRRAGTFLGAGILAALAVMAGTILLIVPGIIVAIALSFVSFFVVDDPALGAFDTLDASWKATRGHRLHLFGLFLLGAIANWVLEGLFGLSNWLMPLQIALTLVAGPLSTLVLAHVYLRIAPRRAQTEQVLAV